MIGWLYDAAGKVFEGFKTKTGEKIADVAIDTGGRVLEFKTELQCLEQNSSTLSSIASDVETAVNNEEQSGRKKRKREVKEWLDEEPKIQRDVSTLLNDIQQNKHTSRFRSFARVEKMNKRVKEHIERKKHFGDELVLDDRDHRGEKFLGKMYGTAFQKNLEQIFNGVQAGGTEIIGIYGAGEAGKTVLARHVYNRLVDETRDRIYWVSVSEMTSIWKLQDDISHAIGIKIPEETDEARRATWLNRTLRQGVGFVLILDNLKECVNLIDVGFPVDVDGCRLVITTCSIRVCRRIGCKTFFEVKMDEDEAWDMFKEVYGQDASFDLQQEEHLKLEVNSRCGFPKKIIELAKIMKSNGVQPGSREWRYQLEEVEGFL